MENSSTRVPARHVIQAGDATKVEEVFLPVITDFLTFHFQNSVKYASAVY